MHPTGPAVEHQVVTNAPNPGRGARLLRSVLLGSTASLAVLLALPLAGCGSLGKAKLEDRLLALPKNAAMAARTLRRFPLRADLGEGPEEHELVYVHVPADAESDAAPLVLVHGTPDTLFAWTHVVFGEPGIAGERDVYLVEVLGHGIAPGSAGGATFERCARFVNAAVEALGLERVHLVGNSYGGEFAWRAVLNDPRRFASLTLVDSSGYARREGDFLPEEEAMRDIALATLGYLLNSPSRIESALAPHFDVIPEGRVDEMHLVCSNRENWRSMVQLARDEDGHREAEIQDIPVPTLIVWGADDVAYEADWYATRFAEDIADARLVVMPETGHYPHEQRPAEFVRELRSFLTEVEESR